MCRWEFQESAAAPVNTKCFCWSDLRSSDTARATSDCWRRDRCDGKYAAIIKDHRNHYHPKHRMTTFHIYVRSSSSAGDQADLWILAAPCNIAVTQGTELLLSFLLNTVGHVGKFILALQSFHPPEIILHWHLQKMLFIKCSRVWMKAKVGRMKLYLYKYLKSLCKHLCWSCLPQPGRYQPWQRAAACSVIASLKPSPPHRLVSRLTLYSSFSFETTEFKQVNITLKL